MCGSGFEKASFTIIECELHLVAWSFHQTQNNGQVVAEPQVDHCLHAQHFTLVYFAVQLYNY